MLNISVVDLDLDPIGSSYWCFDYVDFFRGVYQNITLLHKICLKPSNSIAINGSSTIRFHSDYGGAGRGFRIIITAVSGLYTSIFLASSFNFILHSMSGGRITNNLNI